MNRAESMPNEPLSWHHLETSLKCQFYGTDPIAPAQIRP